VACRTVGSHRTIAGANTQKHTRVTRQGRMTLTSVNAQNSIKY